ncbi:YbaK/EbsC family protein [Paramaledivibacter caminithermalis]|jgi:Cys-tRNA(Pro) deacylase|uniref:Cys-tRNA(Pro) deacylase n=1 Tax=Paramaledivibacter caminithermalis (strain DSM 15212 / CIP 107654 / DViRD3) TaxID=1121301 RepID=A0A1M6JPX0_PARC5|nr:YbaK/EbsC family protein [Paramaledivibacter caminithermalis]SHJ48663.1 Cys-tRNA(Pro) deacylase [Paramaledivibacter caminithermalis DSM 15212]
MALEDVRKYFKENNLDYEIFQMDESTATVELAAKAHGVEPQLIAKTMAVKLKDRNILIVTKGDARIDNRKFKDTFKTKCKMLKPDEVLEITGHPVGGVCPFGLKNPMDVYLDISLNNFEYVYPAAGSTNSSIKITPIQLKKITNAEWIDVCKQIV